MMSKPSEAQRLTSLVFYAAVLLIAFLAYKIVEPFLAQIGWAVVLAICIAPAQERMARRFGPTRSAALLTLLVLFLLILPAMLAVLMLVREGAQVVAYVEGQLRDRGGPMGLFHIAWDWLYARLPFLPTEDEIIETLTSSVGGLASQVAGHAGTVVKGAVSFVFGVAITLGILFFLLKDAPEMTRAARRLLPFGRERNERLFALTRDIVSASVTSMLAVALIQGVLGGLTFLLLGVQGAALWGGLMAALSILPAVGAALVWAPAAIWLAVSGSLVKGFVLAAVGLLVLGNVDNVVRPLLLSGSARMSTLVLIVSLLGGVSAFGFIGIVLGPVVAAVLTALVESYALVPEEPEAETPVAASPPPAAGAAAPPAAALPPCASEPVPFDPSAAGTSKPKGS
jgi:predicted PurR-regulated permease PerM